jgi:hypothetical protein
MLTYAGDMEAKIARTKMRIAMNSKLGFLMRLVGRHAHAKPSRK